MELLNSFKSIGRVSNETKPKVAGATKSKSKATANPNHFVCRGRVRYEDNVYCVYITNGTRMHELVKIDESILDFSKCDRYYSLPANDAHDPWTEKIHKPKDIKPEELKFILSIWGRFRLNDFIYGYVDLTTNTFFGDVRKSQRIPEQFKKTV